MNLGVITGGDIANELISRGITVQELPVHVEIPVPLPVVEVPEAPDQPITVLPRIPIDNGYEPYIPIFPPPTVTPVDVIEDEIIPFIPGVTEAEEKKGLDKGLLILIGITAFALMALAKPQQEPRSRRQSQRPRRSSRRGSFTRRRRF